MATENMIKFYKGALANLPASGTNGALYITTDEGAIYLGTGVGMKRLGDFVQVDAVANLPASANTSALYYCVAENVLAKWTGTEWKQVNKQPTKDELKVMLGLDSEGDVIKAIAAAKKAGDDAQADVDTLTDYVGTFVHDTAKTVVEYINAKTDGIATSGNLEALAGRVTAVEGDVATIKGDYLKAEDKTELEGKITAAQTAADKAQGDVDALTQTHANDKKALEDAIALKGDATAVEAAQSKADSAYELAESKATMDEVNTAIADAGHAAAADVENAINGINDKIGEVTEGKTIVEMIADAETAATYDDTEVRDLITQEKTDREGAVSGLKTELEGKINTKVEQDAYNTKVGELVDEDERLAGLIGDNAEAIEGVVAKVDTLVGEDANKSVRTIANEELAAQLIAENAAEALDSLHEIAAWIQAHPGDAATMNAAIEALQAKVDTGDQTVSAYVAAAIEDLGIGDYATVAALGEAVERIADLEEASATHALKTEVEAVSDALDEYKEAHKNDYDNDAVDAKVKAVQDQIDALGDTYATDAELNAAMEAEVERANGAYAAKVATEAHIDDADIHVTTEDKAKWNGAQAAAEATAATNLATARTEIAGEIATAKSEAIADAEGKIAAAVEEVKTDASNKDAVVLAEAQKATAAAKTELQGNIDTVSGALNTYKTENDAAVAAKADASAVYTKDEIVAMLTWGEF